MTKDEEKARESLRSAGQHYDNGTTLLLRALVHAVLDVAHAIREDPRRD